MTALVVTICVICVLWFSAGVWLLITYEPESRPYVPKQRQEETDKWDDWMNFV